MADVILNKESVNSMININRIVEGKEEVADSIMDGNKDLEMVATKNRERFAIKKTYSLEVRCTKLKFIQVHPPLTTKIGHYYQKTTV